MAHAKHIKEPIRKGADKVEVQAVIGEFKITRSKTIGGTHTLKVEMENGAQMPKPQTFLEKMFGTIGFDPGLFSSVDAAKQRKMILEAFKPSMSRDEFFKQAKIGHKEAMKDLFPEVMELDDIAKAIKDAEDHRTNIGREKKRLDGAVQSFPDNIVTFPDDRRSMTEIEEQRQSHETEVARYAAAQDDIDEAQGSLDEINENITEFEAEMEKLKQKIEGTKALRQTVSEDLESAKERLSNLEEPKPIDFIKQTGEIEEHNYMVGEKEKWKQAKRELAHEENRYEDAGKAVKRVRKCRDLLVERMNFGIEGLELTDDGVRLNGVLLGDISTAEALKVGVRLAMAQNPKARIIRIKHGAALDQANLQWLADWVEKENFQVFVEFVTEEPDGDVIYMTEGRIEGQEEPDAK
jgi:hypothetical protein